MREGYNPFYIPTPAPHAGKPKIRFSSLEVSHIAGAVVILTICFGAVLTDSQTLLGRLMIAPWVLLGAFLAVATGFVLHELAHKVVAQRYGHWAEFRAQFSNLLLSLVLSVATGLLLAAPGAVMIQGAVTRRENGIISLVGPGVNFLIAAVVWPLSWATNQSDPIPTVLGIVAKVNAGLCVFNLIPLGPLDGRKVWHWNPAIYLVSVVFALGLGVAIFMR